MLRAGRIEHDAVLGMATGWIDTPPLGGSRNQHVATDGASLTQWRPERTDRRRQACSLNVQDRVGVKRIICRRMLKLNLVKLHFQFFSEKHRERRVNPLSHLDHRNDQGHGAGWIDPYKSVRRESTRDLVFDHPRSRRREDGLRACTGQRKTKQQTCALKKGAPRHRCFIGNPLSQNGPIHDLKLPRRA
jgi:hypothetical protein